MSASVRDVLVDLARVFAGVNVRWYVIGAQAVIAAGVPRATADVDITAEVPAAGWRALRDALLAGGFAMRDVGGQDRFVAETRVVPAVYAGSATPVDMR